MPGEWDAGATAPKRLSRREWLDLANDALAEIDVLTRGDQARECAFCEKVFNIADAWLDGYGEQLGGWAWPDGKDFEDD